MAAAATTADSVFQFEYLIPSLTARANVALQQTCHADSGVFHR
jgi:ABC-type lipoprotein export system ATPase subunit